MHFLRDASAGQHGEFIEEIALGAVEHVLLGQCHRHAERASAGNDRDLVKRVGVRQQKLQKRVAGLMPGRGLVLLACEAGALAFAAPEHLVTGFFEDCMRNRLEIAARGEKGRLVDDVCEVGA